MNIAEREVLAVVEGQIGEGVGMEFLLELLDLVGEEIEHQQEIQIKKLGQLARSQDSVASKLIGDNQC